jgi:mannose-1-phosphate guanylyltransferase / mannose-6-phosphate isomerase
MLSKLKCAPTDLIKDVLIQLDKDQKKFVVCVDSSNRAIGVVTNGDIRKAFLENVNIADTIDKIYNTDFDYLNPDSSFDEVCELFRLSDRSFLPVINKNKELINVLTKAHFHIICLENIIFDLEYDFSKLDNVRTEHEVYNRPWGFYKSTLLTAHAQAKIITVSPHSELSLQKHLKREEHWVFIKGIGRVILNNKIIDVAPGKYIHIPKQCKHQIINNSDENLILSEVQLGDYFGEDDIIRYADKYGRHLKGNTANNF